MVTEIQWSELQRDPKQAARLADEGAVRVRRRDGASLILIREDRAQGISEGSVAAARALRNLFVHLPAELAASALIDEFPWVELLPDASRTEFVADFVRAFHTSAELGHWSVLAQTVHEWRNTAAVYAVPGLAEELSTPVDTDFGPVPAPIEE